MYAGNTGVIGATTSRLPRHPAFIRPRRSTAQPLHLPEHPLRITSSRNYYPLRSYSQLSSTFRLPNRPSRTLS
ncbi:hypothetical protein DENSPDRAFT_839739 [Dentipellis sp. KUC8613]|nr:hypothetical protein DENSPDRAFT_839739 [Dentipellis sp. KUC8613]